VRFKGNVLRVNNDLAAENQEVILTDDAVNLALGQSSVITKGKNQFLVVGQDWYVEENDSGSADYIQAQQNYWKRNAVHHTTADSIRAYLTWDSGITSDSARVTTGTILSAVPTNVCGAPAGTTQGQRSIVVEDSKSGLSVGSVEVPSGVSLVGASLPVSTGISKISPLPIRSQARIEFDIREWDAADVVLDVLDVRGRRVKTLVQGRLASGQYAVVWDQRDDGASIVAAGVYFLRMETKAKREVQKIVVVR
jgi:hypothetical protein